ncbi:MAG: Na+/H+ antiporter subunit E [Candidatus Competibacteraceae bacterium]|nr:Na+/H+ antiporter subunit E [Candidatus Competibacteraceae bacterium]
MHRWLPHPLITLALTLVWLLLVNSLTTGQIVLGLLLAWAIPLFTLRFWPETLHIRRPGLLLRFAVRVLADIVTANLTVARLILGRPEQLRPVFVEVPLLLKSDLAISLLANTISLTPGTVSSCLSANRDYLLVHTLDTADADALAATIKTRYEAPLQEIFESC